MRGPGSSARVAWGRVDERSVRDGMSGAERQDGASEVPRGGKGSAVTPKPFDRCHARESEHPEVTRQSVRRERRRLWTPACARVTMLDGPCPITRTEESLGVTFRWKCCRNALKRLIQRPEIAPPEGRARETRARGRRPSVDGSGRLRFAIPSLRSCRIWRLSD